MFRKEEKKKKSLICGLTTAFNHFVPINSWYFHYNYTFLRKLVNFMCEYIFPDLSFLVKTKERIYVFPRLAEVSPSEEYEFITVCREIPLGNGSERSMESSAASEACKCVTLFSKACLTDTGTKQQLGKWNISLPHGYFFGKLGFHQQCHVIQHLALVIMGSLMKDWLKKSFFFL